jgi:hypothetical protein
MLIVTKLNNKKPRIKMKKRNFIFYLFPVITCLFINNVFADPDKSSINSNTTEIKNLSFFAKHGLAKGYHILHVFDGNCWTGSIASSRKDAWRCMVGNRIYDPCFANPIQTKIKNPNAFHTLVFLDDPIKKHVIMLQAKLDPTKANPTEPSHHRYWAVELAGGSICKPFTGTLNNINGETINYGCDNGQNLVGNFVKTDNLWSVKIAADEQIKKCLHKTCDEKLKEISVTKVWD